MPKGATESTPAKNRTDGTAIPGRAVPRITPGDWPRLLAAVFQGMLGLLLLTGCSSSSDTGTPGEPPANTSTDITPPPQRANETAPPPDLTVREPASTEPSTAEVVPTDQTPRIDPAMAQDISHWLVQLAVGAEVERLAAVETLDEVDRTAFGHVVTCLREGSRDERHGAAKFLIGRVGPADLDAVDALIEALDDEDDTIRHTAFQALERSPTSQLRRAIPQLLEMLANPQEESAYRVRIVRALGGLGPAGQEAAPLLVQLGREAADSNIRRAVFAALPELVTAEQAESFFLDVVLSSDPADLRRLAIERLARVATTPDTLLVLVEQFRDPDAVICRAASESLVDIGKPSVNTLARQGLDSDSVQVRRYSVFTLGKLGSLASDAIPALEQCLEDPNEEVRQLAAAALRLIKHR